jgi:RsiW-degrading membrane proteinase PrsW (M82 family)
MLIVPALPGLLWLWAFYRTDRYQPEPKQLVAVTFALGALATLPALAGEMLAANIYPFLDDVERAMLASGDNRALVPLAIGCFVVIGPIEELTKFLAVRLYIYRRPEFDEPLDGIIYASAAALGFASLENALYVLDFRAHGVRWGLFFARALLAVPGHVLFSSMWGYALGRAKFGRFPVFAMLALASALHSLYDFLALLPITRPLVLALVVLLFVLVARQIRRLRADSPFRPRTKISLLERFSTMLPAIAVAPGATSRAIARGRFCLSCGLTVDGADRFCGRCGTPLPRVTAAASRDIAG